MNIIRIACVSAIALFAFTPGCGGQEAEQADLGKSAQEQKSAGYGYEFHKDTMESAAAPGGSQVLGPNGKLAPETIRDVVRGNFGALRTCYEGALTRDPATEGTVSVRFLIHEDGSVSDAAQESATISDAVMVGCLVDHFATIQFPASSGGDVTVIYPILFSPGDDN